IPLACTPDPQSAAPVSGLTEKCKVEFAYKNVVRRIYETPRSTKPYSEEDWALINALGKQVDEELIAGDVRLTMGGEPTFVSVDDMESPQWNTEADGAHKQQLARALIKRLHNVFATGGMLHYGQGKWYPGEPLPRWRLSCLWRKDGIPLWQNQELLADDTRDYGFGPEQAERFIRHLAQHLGVDPLSVVEGYEDTFYYLCKEGQLPINIDPLKYNLKDSDERRTLAKLLDRGLGSPVGYALPLKWSDKSHAWDSSKWQFRRGRMYLIPGDSPIGLRLPLDSLPWVEPHKRQTPVEQSLFQPLPELGDYYGEVARRFSSVVPESKPYPEIQEQAPADEETSVEISHTAICVEPRNGRLYVFLPPLTHLEHFLDLTASVESSASALNMPVVLEGYEPPYDFRVHRLLVTPDPGVIEVNIHPASNWDELVKNTVTLYDEAHLARLGTEKFMLDGRHSGTGGGNHVTIGGPTPADSPILRRPYLLQSLITFWQHHPGLSYLFSGLFIGPTSQSPRIDEARNESLYELEIAFQQMPTGESPNPWLVDRLLRHLLVDLTGNTHRAEFCIDKLYSPETSTGRLGLVELRAFEMPPHARMSLVQMLLLRSLIAWFWKQPYRHSLVRWGTELHDRFMLPHYTMADMKEVVQGIQAAGFPFQEKWLEPFFEFRFPFYGRVNIKDIELELRMAIEPWHVLGEEITRAGTARFVDSSVERVQVKVTGITDTRYVVVCNNRHVPLHATGTQGEYVAGVRYRAWQPFSALHPTIGVHSPLVFDVVDTWNGRSIGGCTYYVAHPGGRNYDDFPVNTYAAESRRISRFWNYGHTQGRILPHPDTAALSKFFPYGSPPGPMEPPLENLNNDYPYTLDLRKK
ncbi:MAG TPA: transglutaminase family protein, partial [Thermodesulfovibrionia bacterium]|nr:transglutaminase family protein [Thermodesulfovibrionia bacterium]